MIRIRYLNSALLCCHIVLATSIAGISADGCKCTPDSSCWPSQSDWDAFNTTLSGSLIKGVPPGSVCYPEQPNYNETACQEVLSQWHNSTWQAANPVGIDYPVWTNNSCDPIHANGTSLNGDVSAGRKGCSIGRYPAYVVQATDAVQIGTALKWAGERNIRVIVKSTGHSYPGRSIGYGSLSIWTHHLRGMHYLPSFQPSSGLTNETFTAIRLAASHTGVEVQSEVSKHDAVVVTGSNPDVGMVGWMTGGGHGRLSSTYGMGADNLLEATIVTANGSIFVVNPYRNADLFYAVRGGGGGTYGVVTEVVVRTYPSPKTTMHALNIRTLSSNSTTEYYELMGFIQAQMSDLKAGGMAGYYYMYGPPAYPTLTFYWTFTLVDKPAGTIEKLIAPIEKKLKQSSHIFQCTSNITHYDTYWDAVKSSTNEAVANGGSAYASWLLSPESMSDANTNMKVLSKIGPTSDASKPNGVFNNPILMGHVIASPNEPSYHPELISMNPAWRNTLAAFIAFEYWPEGIEQAQIDSVYRSVSGKADVLRELSPETGAYFNEPDSYEREWQWAFFGDNYERLLGVKRDVDPGDLFWCRGCVGSEKFGEDGEGRLCKL